MQVTTARIVFILYSFVSGLTFGSIFIVFKMSSIMLIFLITAILFGIFALIGRFTKLDLTKAGTILLMMLLGIVICTFVNVFLKNDTLDLFVSYISIIVFLGFTAYDMQKSLQLYNYASSNPEMLEKLSIYGAFNLYLDFVNIFLDILQLLGDNK